MADDRLCRRRSRRHTIRRLAALDPLARSRGHDRSTHLHDCIDAGAVPAPISRRLSAFRRYAAWSAGILMPMAYAVIMRHLPQHLRLYGLSLYALASSLTPKTFAVSIEAWVITHLSWQYLFWINIIPGSLTLLAGAYGLANDPIKFLRFRRHDGFGLLALSFGLAALVTALDQGNRLDWLGSGLIVGLLASALFFLSIYLIHALWHPDPVVSPRLLARRNIGFSLFLMFAMRIGLMTSAYLLPQYLMRIQGYRALESGTMFWVSVLPQIVLTPFVAWLAYRMDPRSLAAFGLMLFGAGVLMLSGLTHLWTSDQTIAFAVRAVHHGTIHRHTSDGSDN
ncbi:MFS transporter, partial [Agrobacterium sp. S2]|nr:MFS transporter [Agrobacterium sp. S2]